MPTRVPHLFFFPKKDLISHLWRRFVSIISLTPGMEVFSNHGELGHSLEPE